MKLSSIITLANRKTAPHFYAMERSLRAVGSLLPIRVIPYDDDEPFTLPQNSSWLKDSRVFDFLKNNGAHAMMRKYLCFTETEYHYVDTDCIFLSDPQSALMDLSGFVTCCGHWRNPLHTTTPQSEEIFRKKSTNWQARVFNAGQFACDTKLYSPESLFEVALMPAFKSIILEFPHHDQPGTNLLAHLHGISVTNITLPPTNIESSWAGDYRDDTYLDYWQPPQKKPYLLHWAGLRIDGSRPIDKLYLNYLTKSECAELNNSKNRSSRSLRRFFGR